MTPKALSIPAFEGDPDAQAMLADYLKETGVPDHIAEESYFGAIHMRTKYRTEGMSWVGFGGGRGASAGRGGGSGSCVGVGHGAPAQPGTATRGGN